MMFRSDEQSRILFSVQSFAHNITIRQVIPDDDQELNYVYRTIALWLFNISSLSADDTERR